jgi:hypothetical protein
MNERQGKRAGDIAAHMMRFTSRSHLAAMRPLRSRLIAAQKMVAECEILLAAVKEGTEQIRAELREKMVELRQ